VSKKLDRRKFLKSSLGAATAAAAAGFVPTFQIAQAANPIGNGNNFINIYLGGGYDGLGMFPFYQGPVANQVTINRPTIDVRTDSDLPNIIVPTALANSQNGMSSKVGLHPNWSPLTSVAENNIKIITSIGTLQFINASHEHMTRVWRIGAKNFSLAASQGWFGKLMEYAGMNMFQAYGIGNFGPGLAFRTFGSENPLVLSNISSFSEVGLNFGNTVFMPGPDLSRSEDDAHFEGVFDQMVENIPDQGDLRSVYKQASIQTRDAVSTLTGPGGVDSTSLVGNYTTGSVNGGNLTTFQRNCQDAAKVLKYKESDGQLQNRPTIIELRRGGFDTHGNQQGAFNTLIPDMAAGLRGLVQDLQNGGAWNKTVICLISEFGRTNRENGGLGTDHAWANIGMVLGGQVQGGRVGDDPNMSDLQNQNRYRATIDYRAPIEAAISYLGLNPSAVFTEPHTSHANMLNLFS